MSRALARSLTLFEDIVTAAVCDSHGKDCGNGSSGHKLFYHPSFTSA